MRRLLTILLISLFIASCGSEQDADPRQNEDTTEEDVQDDTDTEENADTDDPEACVVEYALPPGDSFAMSVNALNKPETLSLLAGSFLDRMPPLLFFADGLTDGAEDPSLAIVGGIGEFRNYGIDETPGTADDIYALHFGSINSETCEFQVQLSGTAQERRLLATADTIFLDLASFSAATEGIGLRIDDVRLEGDLSENLGRLTNVILSGVLSEEGVDELLEATKDLLPISKDNLMNLLDPEKTGVIPVELELEGFQVTVEGFIEPTEKIEIIPREEEACCPEGLAIGDDVQPYLRRGPQGLQAHQWELFWMALPDLRTDTDVAIIATAVEQSDGSFLYHVYSGGAVPEGHIIFKRLPGDDATAPTFEIIDSAGTNPLGNNDPKAIATYDAFINLGTNPNNIAYLNLGYGPGDERLSFIDPKDMHYPFAYERLVHNFDDPRAGELMIIPPSWATGGLGNHGHLSALQSGSPLFISGPGIRTAADPGPDMTVEALGDQETLLIEEAVRQVDIAPTIAAALGVSHTTGVGPDMRLRDDNYLAWQDGRVLKEIFTDEALALIEAGQPVAERAIVLINDGLTNIELLHHVLNDDTPLEVQSYRRLLQRGLAYRFGSVSNFPSNTYPGHNTIGTGAWSGHHGLLDNYFRIRAQGADVSPISDVLDTERYLGSAHEKLPLETIHEALRRTYGEVDDGNLTASINDPITRGAHLATLENRTPQGFRLPQAQDEIQIADQIYTLPEASIDDYAGVMDNASLQTLVALYLDDSLPLPRFTIANFGSSDSSTHTHGPHGDHFRNVVLGRVNTRMGIVLDMLAHLEIDDSTIVILTSDHGMELQDQSRRGSPAKALASANIKYDKVGWYYYFKEIDFDIEDQTAQGDQIALRLRVIDRDSREQSELKGAKDVTVRLIDGGQAEEAITDDEGFVELILTPDPGASELLLELESDPWITLRSRISL